MRKIIAIFFILLTKHGYSQYMDTLHEVFKQKSSIDARLESRYVLINNRLTATSGVRLGVAFRRKLRLGGGISWLNTHYEVKKVDPLSELNEKKIMHLKYGYMCFYADFVFYRTKRWQLSVPIQAGMGMLWYQNKMAYDLFGKEAKYGLFLYEPGISVQYKVFQWFGLGTDVGYRFALKDNKKIGERLSSPMYSFKILIWFDQLFYLAFPDHEITKRYGPSYW